MSEELYEKILDANLSGLDRFNPEDFVPGKGTVLVVLPPKIERIGNVFIPERAQEQQCVARIAAVPDDPDCPVKPGQWVIFRMGSFTPVKFRNRTDLALLEYRDGVGSDILGWVDKPPEPDQDESETEEVAEPKTTASVVTSAV